MKILALPSDPNPYQRLLYGSLPSDVTVRIPRSTRWLFLSYPVVLIVYRLRGYRLLHLHWTYFVSIPIPGSSAINRLLNNANLWGFFLLSRLLRYRIVWTTHNVIPHERQTRNDQAWSRRIARLSTALIIHSDSTRVELEEIGATASNIFQIPHGNYRGVYPSNVTRTQAREYLGLNQDGVVILFFGAIKRYKGVSDLMRAFGTVEKNPSASLVIVGKCVDSTLLKELFAARADNARITLQTDFVADHDVAAYFLAADIVCLPFTSVTTSGSAILALSFGVPVLGPKLGGLADLPGAVGEFYDPIRPLALEEGLRAVIGDTERLTQMGAAAAAYADTLEWGPIGQRTAEVYRQVLT